MDSLEEMRKLQTEFAAEELNEKHEISCDLPEDEIAALIGPNGENIKYIEATGAKVLFLYGTAEMESGMIRITVKGPLLAVYHAHMMLMKQSRANEKEEELSDDDVGLKCGVATDAAGRTFHITCFLGA